MKMASVVPVPGTEWIFLSAVIISSSWEYKRLVPISAASWLDVWDHDSCLCRGPRPCPYRGSGWSSPSLPGSHYCWKQPRHLPCQLNFFLTSSFQHPSCDARWASSLSTYHIVECFVDQAADTLGEGWHLETPQEACHLDTETRHLATWHSGLHLFFVGEHKLPSVIVYTLLTNDIPVCVTCLSAVCWYGKHHHHLEILQRIPLSLPQTLPRRRHVFPHACHRCRQSLPPWPQSSCLLQPSGHCRLWIVHTSLVQLCLPVHSTRKQTLLAASSRGHFSFVQADSMHLAESTAAPAVMATVAAPVITYTLKAYCHCLTVVLSLSLQVRMQGEKLCFFKMEMWAVKSHPTRWCWAMHSLSGMASCCWLCC